MEDKKVKAGSVAVGICLFIIAILLVVIVLFFYNSNKEKNNLQEKISQLETAIDEKEKKANELENKISKVQELISNEEDSNENYLSKQEMIKLLNEIDDKISRKGVLHELRVRKIESKSFRCSVRTNCAIHIYVNGLVKFFGWKISVVYVNYSINAVCICRTYSFPLYFNAIISIKAV